MAANLPGDVCVARVEGGVSTELAGARSRRRVDVDRHHARRTHQACEYDGMGPETAAADDADGLARAKSGAGPQRVERCGNAVRHHGADVERNAIGQSDDGPSLFYGGVDRALEGRESGSATTPTGATTASAATPGRDTPFDIRWEDPAIGRELVRTSEPVLPGWVSEKGMRLRLRIRFDLTAAGYLTALLVEESSGYPDVDIAVLEALRGWQFASVPGAGVVRGRVPYVISPW